MSIVERVNAAVDAALGQEDATRKVTRALRDQGTITHEPQVLGQAAHLWTRTSLRPGDLALAGARSGASSLTVLIRSSCGTFAPR